MSVFYGRIEFENDSTPKIVVPSHLVSIVILSTRTTSMLLHYI